MNCFWMYQIKISLDFDARGLKDVSYKRVLDMVEC